MFIRGLTLIASAAIALAQAPAQVRDSTLGAGTAGYSPITAGERFNWVVQTTVGPANLAAGFLVSGWQTWSNEPREYGPHWEGFGKRYGLRLAEGATGTAMEATLGSLWREDPRYFRTSGQSFKRRLGHAAKMTFMATDRNGNAMPAYARYVAIPGNSFLANTWRPDSQTRTSDAFERIPYSFLTHFLGNTFTEFWPDIRQRVFRKK